MATKCIINKSTMTGIAEAIRAKGGTTETLLPSQMAGAIEALPSGGGDVNETFRKYVLKDIEEINMADVLGYDAPSPQVTLNQHFLNGFSSVRKFYAPMSPASNYMFSACVNITDITVRALNNNTVAGLASCTRLMNLTTTTQNSSLIIGYASLLSSIATGCVIHCTDNDIKNVGGAWVVVERS